MSDAPRLPGDSVLHRLYWKLPPPWRHRGPFASTWRRLARTERYSADHMEAWVQGRLVEMLRHAARHCPYHRARFKAIGMAPEDFRGRDDLLRLPTMGREELRDNVEAIVAENADRAALQYASTGGSSGIPVGFYRHKRRTYPVELAFTTRFRSWHGLSDTSRELVTAGGVRRPDGGRALWALDRRRNSLGFSSDDLTRENFGWMLRMAREYGAEIFRGYPSAVAAFAGLLLESGERLPLKAVYTSSETLYDAQRRRIESAFQAPVHDWYGHSERVVCAGQCERREGYHVMSEYGVLELLDENGAPVTEEGASGEVVGTTLLHDYFPLIRYRTGDPAVFTARRCSCGRPYPLILRPDGRLQEMLVAADGRRISMTSINRHDDLFAAVDQFQFHQRRPGEAVLNVVPGPAFDEAEEKRILQGLREHVGAGVSLTLCRVERIEKTAIGKHRFLIQEIEGL